MTETKQISQSVVRECKVQFVSIVHYDIAIGKPAELILIQELQMYDNVCICFERFHSLSFGIICLTYMNLTVPAFLQTQI